MNNKLKLISEMIEEKHRFVFIDVGAMGGIPNKWAQLKSVMDIIAFEPDQREFASLVNDRSIKYLNYALSDRSEDIVYNITKEPGRSSLYEPNMDILSNYEDKERFSIVQKEILLSANVKNLDCMIEQNLFNDADFIKLDTQGSELSILKGGQEKLIPRIFAAQVEVEFVELYKNQPLFRHVDEFLTSKGFVLLDLRRQYWKRKDYLQYRGKGQLIFADALYFKSVDFLCKELLLFKDPSYAKSKIFKSILTCMVYKMFDYAVAIARSGAVCGYITEDESKKVISAIKECAQEGIISKINIGRFYYIINSILQKFKPASYLGWADSDTEIGNVQDP